MSNWYLNSTFIPNDYSTCYWKVLCMIDQFYPECETENKTYKITFYYIFSWEEIYHDVYVLLRK